MSGTRRLAQRLVRRRATYRLRARRDSGIEDGFTLVELLIVVTILPLIVGALSVGLISVFSLQSGVSSRLSDTADAQVVSANYQNDVQGASFVTTATSSTPQCTSPSLTTATQLLGLESDLYTGNGPNDGLFQSVISYVSVPVFTTPETYQLVRIVCALGPSSGTTPGTLSVTSQTTLANDLPAGQAAPSVTCVASAMTCPAATQWANAQNISAVTFGPVIEPSSKYDFTLVSSPVASSATTDAGSPLSAQTFATCNFAAIGTGPFSANLCFIDFSGLTGSALAAATATGGCLEMSVGLPGNETLYFCLNISGSSVSPYALPTYSDAFLGNTNSATSITALKNIPFYTNVAGEPALYQTSSGTQTTTITLTNISVVAGNGVLATGWEVMSADAESTDDNPESITWSSNQALSVIPNGLSVDSPSDPVGNACDNGIGLTGSGTTIVECNGANETTSAWKDGTAMVEALQPTTMQAGLYTAGGLQAVVFGMVLSGHGS
jgi:prepilin-type N-terminal cleavage/methylation domain-containing protein